MQLIDSHVHLCDDALFSNSDALIEKSLSAGVEKLVVICTNPLELKRGLTLKEKWYSTVYLVGSTTPHESHLLSDDFNIFEKAALEKQLIGLGETGLEYFHHADTKDIQQKLLKRYLSLADHLRLPIVIHCREGFCDLFRILDGYPNVKGVLHCFTGTLDEAKELFHRKWMISFSGIVTFKNSTKLQEVAAWVPIEQLMIETDAPYLAPHPFRGKVNEPSHLPEICKKIASLKNLEPDLLAKKTSENTLSFFSIKS